MGSDDAMTGGPGSDPGPGIEIVRPKPEVVAEVAGVLNAAGCDLGAVEYLIDRSTGRRCYYDLNPYSNFVTGRDDELGFNPTERYIDWVIDRWRSLDGP